MQTTKENGRRPGRPANEQLQLERRSAILSASTSIFAKQGFAETDVQEIADLVGVGKGTIYRYFPGKDVLFLSAVDFAMRQLTEAVNRAAASAEHPLDRIAAGVRAYLSFFNEHPEAAKLLIHERAHFRDRMTPTYFVHREANMAPWRALIQDLIRQGVIRDVPVERVVNAISNLVYGTMFTNYFSGSNSPLSDQCDDILDVLYHGILSPHKSG